MQPSPNAPARPVPAAPADAAIPRAAARRGERLGNLAIGRAIRAGREARAVSQAALGRRVGRTYQQIQHYEAGANGVSAILLVRIAAALAMPVADLLPGAAA